MTMFSARLDETGTDGRSPYAIVAGGVSVLEFWAEVENKYSRLLTSRGVSTFHWKEWMARDGDFKGWSNLKRERFIRAKEKIFEKSIVFTIAIAVHRETHGEVKKRMVGVKRFKPDSDCGICFRYARFVICDKLTELFKQGKIKSTPRVEFIVEHGPYAADAHAIYQEIVGTAGSPYRCSIRLRLRRWMMTKTEFTGACGRRWAATPPPPSAARRLFGRAFTLLVRSRSVMHRLQVLTERYIADAP